ADAEATQRAVGHVARELLQQREIAVHAETAGDAFERAGDALDADTAGYALATRLLSEIGTAFLRPAHHARVLREHFDDAGADNGARLFKRLEVERCSELRERQQATFPAADHHGARHRLVRGGAGLAQRLLHARAEGHLDECAARREARPQHGEELHARRGRGARAAIRLAPARNDVRQVA